LWRVSYVFELNGREVVALAPLDERGRGLVDRTENTYKRISAAKRGLCAMTLVGLMWGKSASTRFLMATKKAALMSKTKLVGSGHGADHYILVSGSFVD
jgi:hypothetical protein